MLTDVLIMSLLKYIYERVADLSFNLNLLMYLTERFGYLYDSPVVWDPVQNPDLVSFNSYEALIS